MATDMIQAKQKHQSLAELDRLLQQLIDDLEMAVQAQDWTGLVEIDTQVNELVHFCVAQGNIKQPMIKQKVQFLARLYRQVIEQVGQERDAVALQLKQEKQTQKVANSYQIASNICA